MGGGGHYSVLLTGPELSQTQVVSLKMWVSYKVRICRDMYFANRSGCNCLCSWDVDTTTI